MSSTSNDGTVRPTKKQRDLLTYIERFIAEHGYSPSYREIMNGLQYTSVATVALHVGNLIRRGHLRKRDHSARSLEIVEIVAAGGPAADRTVAGEETWLVARVTALIAEVEQANRAGTPAPVTVAQLKTVLASLRILGFAAAADETAQRLQKLSEQSKPVVSPKAKQP